MTQYIIRNGGFQKKEALSTKPAEIKEGTILFCTRPTGLMTKGHGYKVQGHFCYLNTYGPRGSKYAMWDEFVTIKGDSGWTIKVNIYRFK